MCKIQILHQTQNQTQYKNFNPQIQVSHSNLKHPNISPPIPPSEFLLNFEKLPKSKKVRILIQTRKIIHSFYKYKSHITLFRKKPYKPIKSKQFFFTFPIKQSIKRTHHQYQTHEFTPPLILITSTKIILVFVYIPKPRL